MNDVEFNPDYLITVAGTYIAGSEHGTKVLKPYEEAFYVFDEDVKAGALSIIVNGYPNSTEDSLLRARLAAQDSAYRGVRTHEVIATERLTDMPQTFAAAHDVTIMSEEELLHYAAVNSLVIDFGLYDDLEGKRAAVVQCRSNPDEYAAAEAHMMERFGKANQAAQKLAELNDVPTKKSKIKATKSTTKSKSKTKSPQKEKPKSQPKPPAAADKTSEEKDDTSALAL